MKFIVAYIESYGWFAYSENENQSLLKKINSQNELLNLINKFNMTVSEIIYRNKKMKIYICNG